MNGLSLRELYRTLDLPGGNPLRDHHESLDKAVRAAYGMGNSTNPLSFLLQLNQNIASNAGELRKVEGPGLPGFLKKLGTHLSQPTA